MEAPAAAYFAARRPGWQLPKLDEASLQLHSFDALEQHAARQPCPKCGKSRSLFCYDCLVPFTSVPSIELPFQLHIVTAEQATKATGTHAAVLCPGQVHMHRLQQLPQLDPHSAVVMFPSDDASTPDQLDLQQMQHVVIIDSPWRKAREVNGFAAFDGMTRVKLPGQPRSCFWRFHTEGTSDEGVCTIEALHLLMRALADRLPQERGYWDNLLWYFAYQHKVVERAQAARAAKRVGKQPNLQQKKARGQQQEQQEQQEQQQQEQGEQQQQLLLLPAVNGNTQVAGQPAANKCHTPPPAAAAAAAAHTRCASRPRGSSSSGSNNSR